MNMALTGQQIIEMASKGQFEYKVERALKSFTEYRIFTGRRESGEVVRVHNSTDILSK